MGGMRKFQLFGVFMLLALSFAKPSGAADYPGTTGDFFGFERHDFERDGRACILVLPKEAAEGKPWIWRARFFGHEPQTDIALLEKGFHLAYVDVAGLFGGPEAVSIWNGFYDYLTKEHQLGPKPALEGMSRGGLIIYNWAKANPEKVSCLYADAPLCDLKSWPKESDPALWAACLKAYHLTEEEMESAACNPIDGLEALAKAKVPLLHVVGDADDVVPVAKNTAVLEARYKALGGSIEVIHKPGVGHHPHSLKDPKPIVDFILRHAGK